MAEAETTTTEVKETLTTPSPETAAKIDPPAAPEISLADKMYPGEKKEAPAAMPAEEKPVEETPAPASEEKVTDTNTDEKKDPAKPENVQYDLKVPEKSLLKAGDVEKIVSFAKEHGLSQEVAQKLLERDHSTRSQSLAAFEASQKQVLQTKREEWKNEVIADKDLGGDKLPQTQLYLKKAMDRFGDSDVKQFLNESGLGNNLKVIRMFEKIGRAMANDTFEQGKTSVSNPKTLAEKMYPDMAH